MKGSPISLLTRTQMTTFEKILKIEKQNVHVDRIFTVKWILDVHKSAMIQSTDILAMAIDSTQKEDADVIMKGIVFSRTNEVSIISAGGLLCQIKKILPIGQDMYIHLYRQTTKDGRKRRKV